MSSNYDSTVDTLLHIKRVNQLLGWAAAELIKRGAVHDASKLESPEKELYDELTPLLAGSTYGSDEYKEFLVKRKPALSNHYSKNSHHPEYYVRGVNGMNLLDVLEMFFDWMAASERHANGDILRSIEINKDRFELTHQLESIFINTVDYMRTYGADTTQK